ncbi:ricin-type beta-trefoil lectin domain protein [Streptomyces sp. KM273126]|uniref:ricin-type beta-trefoil lectin domain protein n=1 Tax=Streptomyces sp. KM273126 TaxID=2545247 RepID=UPI0015EBFDF9|nr:ricin-type beta-trefoil lectin domain protein [Streptomyces sp. KM273126]MBA2806683.1 ricin-type beta-trefoil lectin domain protein [Streptomyces sp. KM273126]
MARGERYDGDAEPEDEAEDVAGAEPGGGDEHGVHATTPDARLTDLLRGDTSTAQHALDELRARHRAVLLAYARRYTAGEPDARQLTEEVFRLAAGETVRGLDPKTPWRHHLLLLTHRVAASWATDDRAVHLAPGLLPRLGEPEPTTEPRLLAAFQALPTRVQGLVWYGVVDEEPDERTATFLGCTREDVTYGAEPAFQALRQSVLTSLLARSANPDCQDFRRLIEEAAHPENPRHSPDLQDHMAHCGHCAGAYQELTALRDTPRTALAEGLLAWDGTAYVLGGSARSRTAGASAGARTRAGTGARTGAGTTATGTASGGTRWPSWLPSRRLTLASAALAVAAAPLLVYLLSPAGSDQRQAAAVQPSTRPTAETAPASLTPDPTPTPTAVSPTPTPTPTRTSRPPKTPSPTPTPTKPKQPPARDEPGPPNGTYAQVVNASSGLCLDIRGGEPELGTDVVTAPCSSSRTQFWRVDTERDVLQSYGDPDYCLDSRGSAFRGVGVWECASVDGRNGRNLRFTVDADGTIVPAVAPGHAVTPYDSGTLFLLPDQGRADQRWQAGAKAG